MVRYSSHLSSEKQIAPKVRVQGGAPRIDVSGVIKSVPPLELLEVHVANRVRRPQLVAGESEHQRDTEKWILFLNLSNVNSTILACGE